MRHANGIGALSIRTGGWIIGVVGLIVGGHKGSRQSGRRNRASWDWRRCGWIRGIDSWDLDVRSEERSETSVYSRSLERSGLSHEGRSRRVVSHIEQSYSPIGLSVRVESQV